MSGGETLQIAVLLVNLGTPDAPTPAAVRRYLAEFLSDPRVIETPRVLWWPILHGVILRVRPQRSAELYRKIWTDAGSPLLVNTRQQAQALEDALSQRLADPVPVEFAMRYGSPSVGEILRKLKLADVRRLLVLPMYPQYAAATTGSVFDAVARELSRWRRVPETRFVHAYHDDSDYIGALAASVREHWSAHGRAERLLLSFHGLPARCVRAGDPYERHCLETARLLADELSLDDDTWAMSFQSRVGREPWLRPYTDVLLGEWARSGIQRVQALCPGFAADCLETLEEIAIRNRDDFVEAGGEALEYIPALNARADHIAFLARLVAQHMQGWPAAVRHD
ncbi:MAG: ferrochelatase [Gammaproteobacteria bacterium]|nr:ferrochelatase [Gammaproteobacteria bacterium]